MLFKRRKFSFVHNHAKVVALQIVIGNVVHANLVFGIAEKSRKFFKGVVGGPWRAEPGHRETLVDAVSVAGVR